jgi:hypothetical protein
MRPRSGSMSTDRHTGSVMSYVKFSRAVDRQMIEQTPPKIDRRLKPGSAWSFGLFEICDLMY